MPSTLITTMLDRVRRTVGDRPAVCRLRRVGGVSGVAGSRRSASPDDAQEIKAGCGARRSLRLIQGRADAPPLTRRVLLSLACALALGLAGAGIDGWLGRLMLVRGAGRRGNRSAGAWMG